MTLRRLVLLILVVAAVWGFIERRMLFVRAAGILLPASALLEVEDQGPDVRWFDDYYTIEPLDDRTFAIGEPRYWQKNFNYLIVGSERAVLYDAGPGVRDIRPVAESLTDKPITFIPSHFHYDHLGDGIVFPNTAVIDLPSLRARARDGRLTLTNAEHLGLAEGFEIPTLEVSEWLEPGSTISLGDRTLRVLHTPGHAIASITLVEAATGFVFAGDFAYAGPLLALLPTSRMGDYLVGARAILESAPSESRILVAHRSRPKGLPELSLRDIEDLETALEEIRRRERSGKGIYPVTYEINDRMSLMAEPRWLQRWGEP